MKWPTIKWLTTKRPAKRVTRKRHTPTWMKAASALLAVLALVLLLRAVVFDVRPVQGSSMEPTLREGEWVLILRNTYVLREPRYGELAVCVTDAATDDWIKRVVGLPGDMLHAEGGRLYRNDVPVDEPYLVEETPAFSAIKSWSEEYLVLGDHRNNSTDSRLAVVGAIPRDHLRGHAVLVVWPPSAWRSL